MINRKIKTAGSNIRNLILFFTETCVIIICYLVQNSIWLNTYKAPDTSVRLLIIISILIILFSSLLLLMFIKRLTLDKKVLIVLGFTAVALGILGLSDLVIKNNISFVDAVYRTFQLFVGEFNDISHEPGRFPIMLNISRFLALFVTFGAISVLLMREKLIQLNIHLFYKDIVVITDCMDKQTTSLADTLVSSGHKVVIGLITSNQEISIKSSEKTPVISFNIDKTLYRGLSYCNLRKSKSVFLLCSATSDNIFLFKKIISLIENIKNNKHKPVPHTPITGQNLSYNDSLELLKLRLFDIDKTAAIPKGVPDYRKFFIKYYNDMEKEYFSIDSSLSSDRGNSEIYFINTSNNALRQIISCLDLNNFIDSDSSDHESVIKDLNAINIGIAGSGLLLEAAFREIPRLCSFSNAPVMTLFDLSHDNHPPLDECELDIKPIDISKLTKSPKGLNLLFICSDNEMYIKTILHNLYQQELLSEIREVHILSENNGLEFNILKKYISNLAAYYKGLSPDFTKPVFYIANSVDLMMSIDDFYSIYGPDIRMVHESYSKSINNGLISDFQKLPEELIESNLLASIHNSLILKLLKRLVSHKDDNLSVYLDYFASVEHERWYMERILQGYILSDRHDYLFNKNPFLVHWEDLSDDLKEKNRLYITRALISLSENTALPRVKSYPGQFIATIDFRDKGVI